MIPELLDIQTITTLLRALPMKYSNENIKIARGKYKIATTWKEAFKKIKNG